MGFIASVGIGAMLVYLTLPAYASGKNPPHKQEKEEQEESAKPGKPTAKLSPVQAMQLSEAKFGGKAKIATFEYDDGHWIYGVIVVKNHSLMEVELDPNNGKIMETEKVTPDSEAKEMKADLARMAKSG
jgi:uncharacterized membrane protein YkoI